MPLLKSKMYVVNSLPLISAIGKNSKNISFIPFVKMAAERLSGLGPAALEQFDGHDDTPGVALETIHRVEHALLSRSEAAELDSKMLVHLEELLVELQSSPQQPRKLLSWIQHVITQASTRAVYGPLNPLRSDETEEAFWWVLIIQWHEFLADQKGHSSITWVFYFLTSLRTSLKRKFSLPVKRSRKYFSSIIKREGTSKVLHWHEQDMMRQQCTASAMKRLLD